MRSFSYTYFYLANPQSFFFHFVRLTEITQIRLRNALGIPHYFQLSHVPSIPFISRYFKAFQGVSALRLASALATVNEEKEGEKEKISHSQIKFSYCQSTLPWLWKNEREKEKYIEEKGEYGKLPFWEYWVLPRNTPSAADGGCGAVLIAPRSKFFCDSEITKLRAPQESDYI